MPEQSTIGTRIIRTAPVRWRELTFLQDDDFKNFPEGEKQKLIHSLLSNDFSQPFYVWEAPDKITYCLDGKHRAITLESLIEAGHTVPDELPATFIDCADMKDAAKMVLLYSSHYATVTQQGFIGFINTYDLKLPELGDISIPNLSEDYPQMPGIDDLEGDGKGKPAVMKITFDSPEQLEAATESIKALLEQFPGAFFSVSAGEI